MFKYYVKILYRLIRLRIIVVEFIIYMFEWWQIIFQE